MHRIGSDIFTKFIREHLIDLSEVVGELLLLVVTAVALVVHEVLFILCWRIVIHVESRHQVIWVSCVACTQGVMAVVERVDAVDRDGLRFLWHVELVDPVLRGDDPQDG